MKTDNLIQDKSYAFAIKIINWHNGCWNQRSNNVLFRQLLRSGTSIGANIEEAIGAQTTKDFVYKMSISYKEARETHYWLRLFMETKSIQTELGKQLLNECESLIKIIGSILRTMKNKSK